MKVVYICLPRVLRWRNWNWFCGQIQFNNNWRVFKGTHELILFGSISSQLCLSLFFPPLAELTRWCSFACYMPTHMIIPVFVPYAALAFSVQNLAMSPKKVPPLLFTSDTEKKNADIVLDGRQGAEFPEWRRQQLPVHMVQSQSSSCSSGFWVTANTAANAGQSPGRQDRLTPRSVCCFC